MNLAIILFNLQSSSLHEFQGWMKSSIPFNGTPPPSSFDSKVLKFCLHDFSSILKVQVILRTTSAILNHVNLIILTYSVQAQNSIFTANDDSDY